MLGRVPPLPDRITHSLIKQISLEPKWYISGSNGCEASGKLSQIPPVQLHWLTENPTKVALDGNSFHVWSEPHSYDQSNLLAILVLAWSYILSARLMELQGQDESCLVYTQSRAPLYRANENMSGFSLDLGNTCCLSAWRYSTPGTKALIAVKGTRSKLHRSPQKATVPSALAP